MSMSDSILAISSDHMVLQRAPHFGLLKSSLKIIAHIFTVSGVPNRSLLPTSHIQKCGKGINTYFLLYTAKTLELELNTEGVVRGPHGVDLSQQNRCYFNTSVFVVYVSECLYVHANLQDTTICNNKSYEGGGRTF